MAPLHGTSFAVWACRNRFAKGTARMLFLKAACNGYQSIVFYGFQRSFHGLESCWCFGLFGSEADDTPRPCLCLALGCFGTGPNALFFMEPVRHSFGVFFAWHGLESCWCFGLFGSEADSTPLLVFSARVFWNRTKALFFMGSKGHVKHSFGVFFAWHGLESCWCFGLFGSEADDTPRPCLCLALGCFGTGPNALFFMEPVRHSFGVFFAWHGLESCWCFGLFGSEADSTPLLVFSARVFWNRTKALFFMGSKGHVKHSFGVFFAWHGLESGTGPKHCFLWVPKVTWSILSACFLHGLESCWCFGLFGSEADEDLGSHRPGSTFLRLTPLLVQKLFFGPWSCWCFGLFGSEADESLSSHR